MGVSLVIIAFIAWDRYLTHLEDRAVGRYPIHKVDTLKMTMDMDKPLHVRKHPFLGFSATTPDFTGG